MARINENVIAALRDATVESGQPKEVAQRLIAWLEALSTGNVDLDDSAEAAKRIDGLLDQVRLPIESDDAASGDDL